MEVPGLSPHICHICQEIEIDGTLGVDKSVEQSFTWSLPSVRTFAKRCELFKWCLQLPAVALESTDYLTLHISSDDEELGCLFAGWKDIDGDALPLADSDQSILHIFAERNDPAAQYIESRPLTLTRARSRDMQICRKHLETCQTTHEECRTAMKEYEHCITPRRLLHIQSDSNERLCTVPQGEFPRYVALSYCWGAYQMKNAMTTKANVQDRHHRAELSQLPQTIKDAVEVNRSLGLDYLWVDALCIIQDDPEDRASEIANMSSIYQGSTLTISAASAKDAMEGFLGDRDLPRAYGSLFQLPYCHRSKDDTVRGKIRLAEHPICDLHEEPIDERAWTMQEHILPLRLVRFGSKQTTWKCPKHYVGIDGGCSPHPVNKDTELSIDEHSRVSEVQSIMKSHDDLGRLFVLDDWLDKIEEYTSRQLSRQSDKLPACAALAEIFAKIMGFKASNYLAGLWEENIQPQLLWSRREGMKAERCPGPTWSWASLAGPVTFLKHYSWRNDGPFKAVLEKSVIIHKVEGHKYSEVESGRLWLNGRLRQAYWDGIHLRRSIGCPEVLPLKICWDLSVEISPQNLWCFEITRSTLSLGLMLGTKNEMDFERVGSFECEDIAMSEKYIFGGVKPRTIILH